MCGTHVFFFILDFEAEGQSKDRSWISIGLVDKEGFKACFVSEQIG